MDYYFDMDSRHGDYMCEVLEMLRRYGRSCEVCTILVDVGLLPLWRSRRSRVFRLLMTRHSDDGRGGSLRDCDVEEARPMRAFALSEHMTCSLADSKYRSHACSLSQISTLDPSHKHCQFVVRRQREACLSRHLLCSVSSLQQ